MRSTFKLLFYINRNKVKSDGTTTIMCRISIDGKSSALTTGIYCQPEDWNARKGIIKNERDDNQLTAFRQRLEQTCERILKEQGAVSSELLKNMIVGVNSIPAYLLEAGHVEIERLRIRAIEIKSNTTWRQSKLSQLNLQEFLLSRGMEDIAFSDITEEFGESFKIFMKTAGERKSEYINKCITRLNRLIYIAIDREVLRSNPIEDVRYEKKEPAKHRYISKSDMKRMMGTPMHDLRLELLRRAFIFSSLTAPACVDIRGLYPHHIEKRRKAGYISARKG
jgi:hypothetical protein